MRAACKAYITCRQELSCLLTTGSHPSIVPLIGLCTHPLSLILHYAPMGSLESILKEYKRTNTQLGLTIYQKLIIQIASAIAHLHSNHIIYLDLKSENILVWNMPQPRLPSSGQVLVKLSDFSISRVLSPIGKNLLINYRLFVETCFYLGTKGFAGTEGKKIL
jgi:serine/threonine protein kinase